MASLASSSQSPIPKRPPGITQLNESVWELYSPSNGAVPEVEIVFFHGLQLSDYQDAFWKTWLSRDRTVVWPKDWLSERFPKARILSISYDSSARKLQGEPDLYVITENVIHDMIQSDYARVGQNCPVILVGHSFGGIVIKQFVLGCNRMKVELSRVRCQLEVDRVNNFLGNCRGVFYYSTPHSGSRIADYADLIPGINRPLMNLLKTLSTETGRINGTFAQARANLGIKTHAIGESLKTNYMGLSAKVVEEASARNDIDGILYTAPEANHFDVCKAKDNKTCGIFKHLVTFVDDVLQSDERTVGKDGDECEGLPNYPVELDSRARDIKKLLLGNSVIGISGIGGIGKTTVAKKVYNDISKHFHYTCFAENVKGIQSRDLKDWLLCHFHKIGTRMTGDRRQWSDFEGRKTMIVLDDVDSTDQISVLPKLHHFGEGSRIILTSRDRHIFKYFDDFEFYEVEFLKDDEAKKLFCQHAFGLQEIPNYGTKKKHLKKNVEAVVKKCSGLPLTLEVIGRYLRNEDNPKVWEETIDKLRKAESIDGGQNDRVWASLRVSYEALTKEEQDMFIEAGTYFFGEQLDVALAAWSSISANSESRWKNLVRRSMVKENQDKTVWVHEHFRDLSWTLMKGDIVSGSYEEGGKLVRQLNAKQVNADSKILKLKCSNTTRKFSDRTLKLRQIAELKELKYLDLNRVKIKGSGKDLSNTLSLLRCIGWRRSTCIGWCWPQLPITIGPMTSLAALELRNWDVRKGSLEALSNLANLRHLSLSDLEGLDHLPKNFGNLSRLKSLCLADLGLCSLPKSFGNLAALERLELSELHVFELPDSFGNLSSLVNLKIHRCKNLVRLPSSFGLHLTSLEELSISTCPLLECLPDSFSLLPRLQQLSLHDCPGLKRLGALFGNLSTLKYLELTNTRIRRLPDSFSQLSGLQRLFIKDRSLKELGDSFGNFPVLKLLALEETCIRRLPESFGRNLSSLVNLKIHRCENLVRLPSSFGLHLTSLEKLSITDCPLLECLPDSFSRLSSLRQLSLQYCKGLKELGDLFGNLSALKFLNLEGTCIRRLPESFGCLKALKELIFKFYEVRLLPDNFGLLTSLRELSIVSRILERFPDSLGELVRLEKLHLDVRNVSALPTSLGQLSSLQNLHISSVELEKLPDSLGQLSSLRNLHISLVKLEKLPDSLGQLSSLRDLHISSEKLEKLPDSLGQLSSLRDLHISSEKLEKLPDSLGQLSSLRDLHISSEKLEKLPDSLGQLSSLRNLHICSEKLEKLPDSFAKLSSLEQLSVVAKTPTGILTSIGPVSSLQTLYVHEYGGAKLDCDDSVEKLPDCFGELCSLRKMDIHCGNLKELPDSLGMLSSLESLTIRAWKLESLPQSIGRLRSLRTMELFMPSIRYLPESMNELSSLTMFSFDCGDERIRTHTLRNIAGVRAWIRRSGWVPDDVPDNVPQESVVGRVLTSLILLPFHIAGCFYLFVYILYAAITDKE